MSARAYRIGPSACRVERAIYNLRNNQSGRVFPLGPLPVPTLVHKALAKKRPPEAFSGGLKTSHIEPLYCLPNRYAPFSRTPTTTVGGWSSIAREYPPEGALPLGFPVVFQPFAGVWNRYTLPAPPDSTATRVGLEATTSPR